jgi:zinc and cadmium transporter
VPYWPLALGLSAVGSVAAIVVALAFRAFHQDARARLVPWLVSYAVGTLLGAALLGLLPQSLASLDAPRALGTMLGGIITFFILEKLVLWRHCHDDEECTVHRSTATLVIVGDAVHTFVDGAVIAASAFVSWPLAFTTALALAAHEVPQQAGDFAILLAAGHSWRRAAVLNVASTLGGLLGAGVMLVFGSRLPGALPFALAFAAGNFLYVAMADLIPHLHRGAPDRSAVRQVVLIGLGILTIALL